MFAYPLQLSANRTKRKTEMPCNSAMPDFIIAGEKVFIRKSPNHIQNTLLIGDSTSFPITTMLIHRGPESEQHEKSLGEERSFSELK
jgi:hypothetical protein